MEVIKKLLKYLIKKLLQKYKLKKKTYLVWNFVKYWTSLTILPKI